jgi:hypothetical protein
VGRVTREKRACCVHALARQLNEHNEQVARRQVQSDAAQTGFVNTNSMHHDKVVWLNVKSLLHQGTATCN